MRSCFDMLDSHSDANQRQLISRDGIPNHRLFFIQAAQPVFRFIAASHRSGN